MNDMRSSAPARNLGFDLARTLAVFGMVVVNFKLVMGASDNGPVWLVRAVGMLEGRAAATFVVLAGVGLSLLSRRARISGDPGQLAEARHTVWARALFLLVVGLAYTPVWPADILHFYGVYLAVAALFLGAPMAWLWASAGALVAAFVGLLLVFDYEREWDWSTLEYEGLWTPAGMVRHLFFNGFHPVVPWLAFVFVGMAVGRLDLRRVPVRRGLFGLGLTATVATEATSAWLLRSASALAPEEKEVLGALFGTSPMPPMPLYMLAGTGVACVVIALATEVGERFGRSPWLEPLVATGQVALTLYVAHVLVGMGTLEALGMLGGQTLATSLGASLLFCVGGVLFAWSWRSRFSRGPVEWVMRGITDRMVLRGRNHRR